MSRRAASIKPFLSSTSMDRRASEAPRGSERHGWRERRAKQDVTPRRPRAKRAERGQSADLSGAKGRRPGIYVEERRRLNASAAIIPQEGRHISKRARAGMRNAPTS